MIDGGGNFKETKQNVDATESKNSSLDRLQNNLEKVASKIAEMFSDDYKEDSENKASESSDTAETKEVQDLNENKNQDNSLPSFKELFERLFSDDFLDNLNNSQGEKIPEETEPSESSEVTEKTENDNTESSEAANDTKESKENYESEELTEEEIKERQKAAIKEAWERIRNGEKLTNEELGNLGEMMMDQYYISKGYKPLNKHRVTSLDDKKGGFKTGIDGVYEKTNPDGGKSYVVADAKYNTSQLSETQDGKQMCDNWIDKRLDNAVGKEKADEIREAAEDNPDSVEHVVYHIDPNVDENGNIHTDIQKVDSEANKIGDKIIVECFDKDGNRIESIEGGAKNEG